MAVNPLAAIETLDPELYKLVETSRDFSINDGALPKKVKYLIAMALDASHGAEGGVASLARAAMNAGATKEEIAEALRVAHFVSGVGSVYTAGRGLSGLF